MLISGQDQDGHDVSKNDFDIIVENKFLLHWFMVNLEVYASNPYHVKVSAEVIHIAVPPALANSHSVQS